MKKTLVQNVTPLKARLKYTVTKQCKIRPAQSQVQNTTFSLSPKYMIDIKKSLKYNLERYKDFLCKIRLLMDWCKIHSKFSLEQNTRNKEKISPKSKKYFGAKNTLQIGQSKIYDFSQLKIHGSKYTVYNTWTSGKACILS